MENQHQHIRGYRDLTAEEIAMINQVKAIAGEVDKLIHALDCAGRGQLDNSNNPSARIANAYSGANNQPDPRWLSIARTDLQKGFMSLTRAVAKPEGF